MSCKLPNCEGAQSVLVEQRGQMAVELTVLIPVIIVVALICFNALRFAELVARFDRVALDAVLIQGVSPGGSSDGFESTEAVRQQIIDAMPENSCEVQVKLVNIGIQDTDALINLAAGAVRYTCSFTFTPWPSAVSFVNVSYRLPLSISHERSLVVDRYRAAIIT